MQCSKPQRASGQIIGWMFSANITLTKTSKEPFFSQYMSTKILFFYFPLWNIAKILNTLPKHLHLWKCHDNTPAKRDSNFSSFPYGVSKNTHFITYPLLLRSIKIRVSFYLAKIIIFPATISLLFKNCIAWYNNSYNFGRKSALKLIEL